MNQDDEKIKSAVMNQFENQKQQLKQYEEYIKETRAYATKRVCDLKIEIKETQMEYDSFNHMISACDRTLKKIKDDIKNLKTPTDLKVEDLKSDVSHPPET